MTIMTTSDENSLKINELFVVDRSHFFVPLPMDLRKSFLRQLKNIFSICDPLIRG